MIWTMEFCQLSTYVQQGTVVILYFVTLKAESVVEGDRVDLGQIKHNRQTFVEKSLSNPYHSHIKLNLKLGPYFFYLFIFVYFTS